MREVLEREQTILSKARTIKHMLALGKTPCEVEVNWTAKQVKVYREGSCIGELPFETMLKPDVGNQFIANYLISCMKR
jgi:hypothetical protein